MCAPNNTAWNHMVTYNTDIYATKDTLLLAFDVCEGILPTIDLQRS